MEFKEPRRARRIRDRQRLIEKARRLAVVMDPKPQICTWTDLYGNQRNMTTWEDLRDWHNTWAIHNYQNLADCSCYMCGNPRKYCNVATWQEAKSDLNAEEQLLELGVLYRRRFRSL